MKNTKIQESKNYYVYKVEHPETGQFYFGSRVHYGEIEKDTYKGSMIGWRLTKSEKQKLIKTVIKSDFETANDMYEFESYIIRKYINEDLNENYSIPHPKFNAYNRVTVKTPNNKIILVSKDDPDYISGKLKFMHCGSVTVRCEDEIIMVDINDPRYLSGELKFMHCEMVNVLDHKGNHFKVSNKDPRYLSGELISSSKNTVLVKDDFGKKMRVSINDSRYQKGELNFIAKGKVCVKDKAGKCFYVDVNDPRYLNGELVGSSKGYWSWSTKIRIDDNVMNAKGLSKIYNVRVKNLKEFLENSNINYEKVT